MPAPRPETGRLHSAPSSSPRDFQLIGVGLPKTGTTTLAAMFGQHRWGHEYLFEQSIEMLHGRLRGTRTDAEVADFWRNRDRQGQLECDSASFHHYVAPLLPDLFPSARYVLTVRAPADWAGSFVNMMVRNAKRHSGTMPAWQHRIGELMIGEFSPEVYGSPGALAAALPDLTDRYLAHWASSMERVIRALPRDRTLVLETDQLSLSQAALAAHAKVSPESLDTAHANQALRKEAWLTQVPQLSDRVAVLCGSTQSRLQAWTDGHSEKPTGEG